MHMLDVRHLRLRTGVAAEARSHNLTINRLVACRRATPEMRASWDLSGLKFIMSGAEPIRAETMSAFFTTFAECKLRPSVFCSAYGLAEHVCGALTHACDLHAV